MRIQRPSLALAATLLLLLAASLFASPLLADVSAPGAPWPAVDAAEIELALRNLQVVGTVLHVGAHPDDENTALLAYLARERGVRTVYLALTRGDGGQNLIGKETGELLGLIRTQELLAARRIDGAEQRFTRALDFGFSKSVEETLRIWDRDAVLGDVVRVIRQLRPDVIINRFPPDKRAGHGQHTASAVLSLEAFRAAADPARFPEQLQAAGPWQSKRVLWNLWQPAASDIAAANPPFVSVDLGTFNPRLGRSYNEIAAASRSQHKSQGFGASARRGTRIDYFMHAEGEPAERDLFDGVDLSWSRVPGGAEVGRLLAEAEARYSPRDPAAIVPSLLAAHAAMSRLPADDPRVADKRRDLEEVIRAASGLWLEAIAATPSAAAGETVAVNALALNRSRLDWQLERVEVTHAPASDAPAPLAANEPKAIPLSATLPADLPPSQPYWLRSPVQKGLFQVEDGTLIGNPESSAPLRARFALRLGEHRVVLSTPVLFRSTDPVEGERYRVFAVTPRVKVTLSPAVLTFPTAAARSVEATVRAAAADVGGTLRLEVPAGWRSEPASAAFRLEKAGEESVVRFEVTPKATGDTATLRAVASVGGREIDRGLLVIDHPHIPAQTLFPKAETRAVRLDLATVGHRIGYVMGAGDDVPEALRQMGFEVSLLSDADLEGDLARFDAVVLGVRAYNTRPRLAELNTRLLAYVEHGGTLVAQYNTAGSDLAVASPGPFPFQLSRDRITEEDAVLSFVRADHPLLTTPNRITAADFEGWVQERGLYFPNPWDPRYETVLSGNDSGETPMASSILYARHGKGVYIYTGLSFFRQLPAGVPGAVRLFANLVSAR